jgi:hypothetical protein
VVNEKHFGKSSSDLIEIMFQKLLRGSEENSQRLCQESRCPGRDSYRATPEYKPSRLVSTPSRLMTSACRMHLIYDSSALYVSVSNDLCIYGNTKIIRIMESLKAAQMRFPCSSKALEKY